MALWLSTRHSASTPQTPIHGSAHFRFKQAWFLRHVHVACTPGGMGQVGNQRNRRDKSKLRGGPIVKEKLLCYKKRKLSLNYDPDRT